MAKPIRLGDLEHAMHTLLGVNMEDDLVPAASTATMDTTSTVFVVDDDDRLLQTLRLVLEKHDLMVETYASCEAFLNASHPWDDGCLLVDGYLPGMNGLELLQRLKDSGRHLHSIMMTGNSDVTMAVKAMKAGASDFIEKPLEHSELLDSIDRALAQSQDEIKRVIWQQDAAKLTSSLTMRQKQIMTMVVAGHPSKNIAADLRISQRTVENHKASIMTKTGSKSLPALAHLALVATQEAWIDDHPTDMQ